MDAGSSDLVDVLPQIFPELYESEDEKIRKELWQYFHDLQLSCDSDFSPFHSIDDILAWLERQKPAIIIPKFRVNDTVISTKNPKLTYKILEIGHINELNYPEYKIEILIDGKAENPSNIKYIEIRHMDEWGDLVGQKE